MAVEFVLLAPLMIALILFIVLCGRVLEAHGQVDGAARDAARAASIARSSDQAAANATAAASADLSGWCVNGAAASVTGFAPASTQVVVQVSCTLDLQPISFGTVSITGFAVAPLDSFVARS
jgi:Flp pilus assembly protein TadG